MNAQLGNYTIILSSQSTKNGKNRIDIKITTATLLKMSIRAQILLVLRAHESIYVKIYYMSRIWPSYGTIPQFHHSIGKSEKNLINIENPAVS